MVCRMVSAVNGLAFGECWGAQAFEAGVELRHTASGQSVSSYWLLWSLGSCVAPFCSGLGLLAAGVGIEWGATAH